MAIARLAAVSLDAAEPGPVAAFYARLADLTTMYEADNFVALRGAGLLLTVQRVAGHRPPTWPSGDVPQQVHLEFAVNDLEAGQEQAVAIGATLAETQPSPDRWRVLLDPAGHPFCLTTLIPDG